MSQPGVKPGRTYKARGMASLFDLRASGVLLHPTSLPGPHGIGDLGEEAYRFVDFLAAARQRLWQILPLGPVGYGNSPYAALSAFAGNPLLISLPKLAEDGLLSPADLMTLPLMPVGPVDYEAVAAVKRPLLRLAHTRLGQAPAALCGDFAAFAAKHREWLPGFALYMALREANGQAPWYEWEPGLRRRDPASLAAARARLADEVSYHSFLQFAFYRQWRALRAYAAGRDVRIVGDMPIFVAHDSADVWQHPELFKLGPDGRPLVVAGVPPDYFSATGQLWGNPIYDWETMARRGYAWWIARVRGAREEVDAVRLDHFLGFASYWEVPAGEATAVNGRWVPGPGAKLFAALRDTLGELPFIAEDLGVVTPAVEALRDNFGLPGMAVLQFAFDGGPTNVYLPHNLRHHLVVYTGTHDNDTTRGWFAGRSPAVRETICRYLGGDGGDIAWDLVRAALTSVANTAIIPLQDILDLGTEARMNLPGTVGGNWRWRYGADQLSAAVTERLAALTEVSGRGIERGEPERVIYTSPGDVS
ncbi:MAG: 4-alpha-glucanotransferase [Chloroflexota bacterium]